MIKLIAFDWNGTLFSDTNPTLEANNITFQSVGLKPLTLKKFQETFSVPIVELYAAHGFPQKKYAKLSVRIQKTFHSAYEARVTKIRTRSGARDLLEWLSKNNINSIIYSNHTTADITHQLNRLKIKQHISKILARTEKDMHSHLLQRQKEFKLANYIKSSKLKKTEIITIGDTCEEIEIGKKLGYKTIALTGGFNTTKRLKAAKPDFLIHNMAGLIKIIKSLNR